MKADRLLRNRIPWLAIGVAALLPHALGQGAVRTLYENIWYPRGATVTNWAPTGTMAFGGSDFDTTAANRAPTSTGPEVRITQSRFGMTCGALEANFNLGQVLPAPPLADTTRKPDIVGEGTNRVAWVDYAQELFAIDQGVVTVNWYVPNSTNRSTITYTISDYPAGRPVRLYWTEPPYNAPLVTLPTAPILPTIYYNYQIPGTNQVWLDTANSLHAATGVRGKFLLTYSSKNPEGVQVLQGAEVVEVIEPLVVLQSVGIGQRLLPASVAAYGTEDLQTRVVRGFKDPKSGDPGTEYLYQHAQGRQNGWLYALRRTDAPWQVEVYWMAKSLLDVVWPFEVDHYEIDWAPDSQLYVRGAPETGNPGPSVLFPDEVNVELMSYQDPPDHAILEGQSLTTTQPGFCLLKYVQGEEVAFDAVHSVHSTDPDHFDLGDWTWDIGRELEPELPKTHGAIDFRGGYVSVGEADGFTTNVTDARALTIEAWVRPRTAGPQPQTIVAKGDQGYSLGLESGRLCFAPGGTDSSPVCSSGLVPTNRWSHVAVAVQSSATVSELGSVQFYIDGQPAGTVDGPVTILSHADDAHPLMVGKTFDGGIDEVRVWAAALPGREVTGWMGLPITPEHPYYRNLAGEFRFEEQTGKGTIGMGASGWPYAGVLTGNVAWEASGARLYEDPILTAPYRQWPGYLQFTTGSGYNVNLYRYPTAASRTPPVSQVFPVNRGRLEVWWANQTRCGMDVPIFWPSLVNLYTNRWPSAPPAIVIASELGNESANLEYEGATALLFDGAGNYLQVPDSASLGFTDHFSLECWVYPTAEDGPLLSKGVDRFTLMLTGGRLRFLSKSPGLDVFSTASVPADKPSHVAVTFAAGLRGIKLYLNGQLAGEGDAPATGLAGNDGPLYVGWRSATNSWYAGFLDEVRIWNRVLTRREVEDQMYAPVDYADPDLRVCYHFDAGDVADGTIIDWSGYANHARVVNAPTQWSPGIPYLQPGQAFTQQEPQVYYQNDPAAPGYNPNEEHAFALGDRVYALRDDFNTPGDPAYVLVQYAPPELSPRHAMTVFRVLQTNAIYRFHKDVVAGSMLQPPLPLSLMAPSNCEENYFTNETHEAAWVDRKNYTWARNAAHDGTNTASITMKYYYPVLEGFFFPGQQTPPAVGTHIPWLSGPNTDKPPIDYDYTVRWPDAAPVLNVVGTLIEARDGLPAIRGQKSVGIVYQQSDVLTNHNSVELLDPTVARTAPLRVVPSGLRSYLDPATGYTYFSDLPPDLRDRLYWNPTALPGQELQLIGRYKEMTDSRYNYLNLNVLTSSNRTAASTLPGADDAWRSAIEALPADPVILTNDSTPFDSIALSAGAGKGVGYVTLIFNDSRNRDMVADSDVIDMKVIRVDRPKYVGKLDLILSSNPLDQQLNLRYTADFAGTPESYEFQWEYAPGTNPDAWDNYGGSTKGLSCLTVGDAGIFGLSDHWIRCRYRALDERVQEIVGTDWSDPTPAALAEGWIKRVMAAITPYEQRIKDFQQGLLTTRDMIAQAGPPYDGDVPLNVEALNQNGLIQIYQTVLEKSKRLSIDYGINDPDANLALLLAAGRVSDLYMLLGNEAYADALDPTIGLGTSDPAWGSAAPSIFCFMNQVPSLLDEELALLRGRDDAQSPPVDTYPVENRLFWNFTSDITGGEVAYALNYDIRDANGQLDGFIDAGDAQALYPQGHGDAWGHYLTSLQGYYTLLRNTNFVWIPQSEAINVGTEPVGVSYLHEQRFCQSAAAKARTGALIVGNTWRSLHAGEEADTWTAMRDSDTNRCWGVAEWASRAGQGAYFDWLVGNALLPDRDPDPGHSGIRRMDRQTVPELVEIPVHYREIQQQVDHADGGMNPLGLAGGVVPFDISPAGIDDGDTHFEQIYDRAIGAWRNALAVFDHVRLNAQALRNQAESAEAFNRAVVEAETDFTNRLVEIYGYPYADDIGAGKPYPQGYQGPDLLHYAYIDLQDITGLTDLGDGRTVTLTVTNMVLVETEEHGEIHREIEAHTQEVDFYIGPQGLPARPDTYTGQRRAEGRLQMALKDYVRALSEMRRALDQFHELNYEIEDRLELLESKSSHYASIVSRMQSLEESVDLNNESILTARAFAGIAEVAAETAHKAAEATAHGVPEPLEPAEPVKTGALTIGTAAYAIGMSAKQVFELIEKGIELANEEEKLASERDIQGEEHNLELEDDLAELRLKFNAQEARAKELQALIAAADQARMACASTLAEGQRLQVEQQTFRRHTAGPLQAERYRNMAFRIFRNDALQRYTAAFDLAARYTYLAAKAYDYETALPIGTTATLSGRSLMTQIVRARSLGRFTLVNDTFNLPEPLAGDASGDPGLADILARLEANWSVLKGRYGFNNPETETGRFSLRTELFRVPPGEEHDSLWRADLGRCVVTNLLAIPEFRRYCLPFAPAATAEPGLVIPFSSTIQFGKNFFGLDLAAGDNAYDSSHFATKIRSVGIWFDNFNSAFNVQTTNGGGLANMPRVYLIPVGMDVARVPSAGNATLRTWTIFDQALPVPYPLTPEDLVRPDWIPLQDSLGGGFGTLRKHAALRAYHDGGFDPAEMTFQSRLIGRSVWNTQWLLIIPGRTLLSDGAKGIQRFIHGAETSPDVWDENGVKDIKIFFQTYSYAGN